MYIVDISCSSNLNLGNMPLKIYIMPCCSNWYCEIFDSILLGMLHFQNINERAHFNITNKYSLLVCALNTNPKICICDVQNIPVALHLHMIKLIICNITWTKLEKLTVISVSSYESKT